MKKLSLTTIAILLLFAACKQPDSVVSAYSGSYYFRVENGRAIITGLQEGAAAYLRDGEMVIPKTLQNIPVSGIGENAFKGRSEIRKATFQVTTPPSLGQGAFDDIPNLTIQVPPGTVSIFAANEGFYPYSGLLVDAERTASL